MEQRPHRATDDFSVPEVNGSGQTDGGSGAEGSRRPHDRPDIAWVLHGVENDEPKGLLDLEGAQVMFGDFGDGEYSLRGLGIGRGRELGTGDLLDRNAALTQRREERLGVGEIGGGRCDESAANHERRTKQLVDGANAFDDEETLALARVAALQVTGYAEHTHATGT
jgi:hypothetical protein